MSWSNHRKRTIADRKRSAAGACTDWAEVFGKKSETFFLLSLSQPDDRSAAVAFALCRVTEANPPNLHSR